MQCSSEDDCAGDQSCNSGFCVSDPMTECIARATPDAGTSGGGNAMPDAGGTVTMVDAGVDAPPDAPTHGVLTLEISGRGRVDIEGVGTCDSDPPQNGSCTFAIPLALTVTMRAIEDEDDWKFDRWTTNACPDRNDDRCVFVPFLTMNLGAKFKRDN